MAEAAAQVGGVAWGEILGPDLPILEIFIRGSITYLALFALLRFVLRREVGELGLSDLLVVVLIADAAQNAMAGGYESVLAGILLVAVIAFWAFALDWLSFHVPALERLMRPRPRVLIRNGRLLWQNMKRELVTEDELFGMLREHGIEDPAVVKSLQVEHDGKVSVVQRESPPDRADGAGREG